MSDNPLITSPRTRTEYLYPGDIEDKIDRYDEMIEAAYAAERSRSRMGARDTTADDLAAEKDELVARARETSPKVVMRALTHREVQGLHDAHPPRQGNKGDEMVGYNRQTFAPALVRACIVEPEVSDAQWEEFLENAGAGRLMRLYQTADELTGSDVDLPKSSAVSTLSRAREREQRRRGGQE